MARVKGVIKDLGALLANSVEDEAKSVDDRVSTDVFESASDTLEQKYGQSKLKKEPVVDKCSNVSFSLAESDIKSITKMQSELASRGDIFNRSEIVRLGLIAISMLDNQNLAICAEAVKQKKKR